MIKSGPDSSKVVAFDELMETMDTLFNSALIIEHYRQAFDDHPNRLRSLAGRPSTIRVLPTHLVLQGCSQKLRLSVCPCSEDTSDVAADVTTGIAAATIQKQS